MAGLEVQTFSMVGVMSSWMGGVGGALGVGGDLSALEEKYCHLAKVEVDEMSEKLERSKRDDFGIWIRL